MSGEREREPVTTVGESVMTVELSVANMDVSVKTVGSKRTRTTAVAELYEISMHFCALWALGYFKCSSLSPGQG